MSRALYTASTGMLAQERRIDVIANNLANISTDGFKASQPRFDDLMYQTLRAPGTGGSDGRPTSSGTQVGLGVKNSSISRDFTQGTLRSTGRSTDLVVRGQGFFMVRGEGNSVRLTRNGAFTVSARGELVNGQGWPVLPQIQVPRDTEVSVSADGTVEAVRPDGSTDPIGRIELAQVLNEELLEATGNGLFMLRDFDVNARVGAPGEGSLGSLEAGFLEGSNVKVVEEMIAMITGQRAYEANSRVIQTADRMMEEANSLR